MFSLLSNDIKTKSEKPNDFGDVRFKLDTKSYQKQQRLLSLFNLQPVSQETIREDYVRVFLVTRPNWSCFLVSSVHDEDHCAGIFLDVLSTLLFFCTTWTFASV